MSKKKYILEQQKVCKLVTQNYPTYYLSGGTALAMQLDHRFSEDLDFFTQKYDRSDPEKIMEYIKKKTDYDYTFLAEKNEPNMIPMKMYLLQLPKLGEIKLDFVQDPYPNINPIQGGLHSVPDIYFRKIAIAAQPGGERKTNDVGNPISQGRQTARDVFDLYYLSQKFQPLSEFYPLHFKDTEIQKMSSWYRSMDRMSLKIKLMDELNINYADKVVRHLDDQIIRKLSMRIERDMDYGMEL